MVDVAAPVASSPTSYTESQWAAQVLADAKLPDTSNNIANLEHWMSAEEPQSDWFDRNNPLNASLGTNSVDGTGSYSSLTQGAAETAAMIRQANMSGIYNALAANDPLGEFGSAVEASPWASSHYAGDPIAGTSITGGGNTLVSDVTGSPSNQDSILGSIGGAVGSAAGGTVASGVEDLFGINGGSGLATRILLAIVGLILLAVGVSKLLDRQASPTDVIVEGGQNAAQQGQSLRQRGNSGAAPKGQRPFQRHPTGGGGTPHSKGTPFDHAAKDAGKGAAAAAMA